MPENLNDVSENLNILVEKPLVSVSIITYNHENFIRQTIDSVLNQEVNFDYEIIIGDDFSKDGTQDILREYQQLYPDKIQLILHPRDYDCIPGRVNNITNLYACRGKYIAMLDGDDFWLSTNKLQKQIDFLEEQPDYALVFNDTIFKYSDGSEVRFSEVESLFRNNTLNFTHDDLCRQWFIQTSSMVFRNHLIGEFPEWFWKIYSADYAIQLFASKYGDIRYFPDLMSVRNFHTNSFSATENTTFKQRKLRIDQIELFKEDFPNFKKYQYQLLGRTYLYWTFDTEARAQYPFYLLKSFKYYFLFFFTLYGLRENKILELKNLFLRFKDKLISILKGQ